MGVDSLMAVQFIRAIEAHYDVQLYPTLLIEHPTPRSLEGYLRPQIQRTAPAAVAPLPPVIRVLSHRSESRRSGHESIDRRHWDAGSERGPDRCQRMGRQLH